MMSLTMASSRGQHRVAGVRCQLTAPCRLLQPLYPLGRWENVSGRSSPIVGVMKTTSVDPPEEKGGSTLDLSYHSCHTRAGRGTTPKNSEIPPQKVFFLGIDRLLPKAMIVPRDLVKQLGSSCDCSNKLA